jgi:hypothetical protein
MPRRNPLPTKKAVLKAIAARKAAPKPRGRTITDQQVADAMPLFLEAVRSKVAMYNAMTAIEDILGFDAKDLDDTIEGLAFNCDAPEDALESVTEKAVREYLKHAKKDGK